MAARFRKPSSGKQVPIAPPVSALRNQDQYFEVVQGEGQEYLADVKPPSALDYLKASPTIAKEVLPSLLKDSLNPIGSASGESLSRTVQPELNRALVQARTGQGMGRPTQIGKVSVSPQLQMLSRLTGGATDALLNSGVGSFFSADTAGKALKQGLGYGKDKVSKGDLAMLGLVYGTGPTVRAGKKGIKALKAILSKLP